TRDALPFNNVRHATFALRGRRKLLTIVPGEPPDPFPWVAALEARAATGAVGAFAVQVEDVAKASKRAVKDLAEDQVVCLHQLKEVPGTMWKVLEAYVKGGGGLAIVPPGDEVDGEGLRKLDKEGAAVLPAKLEKLASAPAKEVVYWAPIRGAHPLVAPFQ